MDSVPTAPPATARKGRTALFWIPAGCAAVAALLYASGGPVIEPERHQRPAQDLPTAFRTSPLLLASAADRKEVPLPPERLRAALGPVIEHEFSRWNQLIHGLRLWGSKADGPGKWTGQRMLGVVCSAEQSRKVFGVSPQVLNRNGLHFAQVLERGEKHLDETLSVLAEIGINSDHPILFSEHTATVSDAVRASATNFVLTQTLDFSAVVLAHYLPPQSTWTNKFGDTLSFDDVCRQLCDQPLGQGNCYGCHAMYALAVIVAADGQHPILSDGARRAARTRMLHAVSTLRKSQRGDGCWDTNWFDPAKAVSRADAADPLSVTGHSLEWLAVAPPDIVGDPQIVSRACEGLLAVLLTSPPGSVGDNYNAFTHAARALKVWSPRAWTQAVNMR